MAPEHLSTAVKEWSLTKEQVALIESFIAHSHHKPHHVAVPPATAFASNTNVITVLVPTAPLLDQAGANVAEWNITAPSSDEVHGGGAGSHLSILTLLKKVHELIKHFREIEGLLVMADVFKVKALAFITHSLKNPHADGYAVWDATSITKQVLSIGDDGASPPQPEDLSSEDDYYSQIQLALTYYADTKSFTCVESFVQRTGDELTEAIKASGTTVRINSIRLLYANLLAQSIKEQYKVLTDFDGVELNANNKPYPDLGE